MWLHEKDALLASCRTALRSKYHKIPAEVEEVLVSSVDVFDRLQTETLEGLIAWVDQQMKAIQIETLDSDSVGELNAYSAMRTRLKGLL